MIMPTIKNKTVAKKKPTSKPRKPPVKKAVAVSEIEEHIQTESFPVDGKPLTRVFDEEKTEVHFSNVVDTPESFFDDKGKEVKQTESVSVK